MKLFYQEQGTGQTIIFLHGFPMDHTFWSETVSRLGQNHHVVTPDLRGFGQTPTNDEKTSMETFADDVAELIQNQLKLHIPVVLCGLSMGGYIAMQFVKKYPNLLRGLILTDTRTKPDTDTVAANRILVAEKLEIDGPGPLVDGMLPRIFGPWAMENAPELVKKTRDMMTRQPLRGIAAAARGMAERPDTTNVLESIACPVLVVCGEDDASSPPSEMLDIAERIAGSTFVEIPKAGHLPPIETPQHYADVVENFMESLA